MKHLYQDIVFNESVDNATAYSSVIPFTRTTGEIAVEVISTAGNITITQQCSSDQKLWYDPVDGSGNALGAVVAAMTVGSKWVIPSAVLATYMRYKVVENNVAASTVKVRVVIQEEN